MVIEKLEKLVQNRSIVSIVGAQPTAAQRNGRRDKVAGIMCFFFFFGIHKASAPIASGTHTDRGAVIR